MSAVETGGIDGGELLKIPRVDLPRVRERLEVLRETILIDSERLGRKTIFFESLDDRGVVASCI